MPLVDKIIAHRAKLARERKEIRDALSSTDAPKTASAPLQNLFLATVDIIRKPIIDFKERIKRTTQEFKAEASRIADIKARRERRFPPEKIFLIPNYVLIRMSDNGEDLRRPFYSEPWEEWEFLLKEYPEPAEDENERQLKEQTFWFKYAFYFSKKNSRGRDVLEPKNVVMDYFESNEKWILREYFAASGTVIDPIIKPYSILWQNLIRKESWDLDNRQPEVRAIDDFHANGFPEHYRKWGEWFFFNIQGAFEKLEKTDAFEKLEKTDAFEKLAKAQKPIEAKPTEAEAKPTPPKQGRIYDI